MSQITFLILLSWNWLPIIIFVCYFLSPRTIVLSHSVMSDSFRPHGLQLTRLLCPWGFSRQEYWSGLPCPPPGDLPNPGIEPRSPPLQADSLLTEPTGKPTKKLLSPASLCIPKTDKHWALQRASTFEIFTV